MYYKYNPVAFSTSKSNKMGTKFNLPFNVNGDFMGKDVGCVQKFVEEFVIFNFVAAAAAAAAVAAAAAADELHRREPFILMQLWRS